jgi:predicted metal-dependent peptidase
MSKAIQDPKDLCGQYNFSYEDLNEKIVVAKMKIAMSPEQKGSPFIYCFSSTKEHVFEDIKLPYKDENGETKYSYTAATDGKKYYWSPQMVNRLSPLQIAIVMCHETYHVILQHCDAGRSGGKNKKIWNIAIDYVVNSMIENDARTYWKDMSENENYHNKTHPIWNGSLGEPLTLKEFIDSIKKTEKAIKDNKYHEQPEKKEKVDPDKFKIFADYSQFKRSAEEIYDEIMKAADSLSNTALEKLLEGLGANTMDEHSESSLTKSKLLEEIMEAAQATKQMVGKLPSGIEDHLNKLLEPKLRWQDVVKCALQKRRQEKGNVNDWSRFRRRPIYWGHYTPKKKDDFVRWLALLDTSGSMSVDDMTYGVSQLRCLDGRSEGTVVCCDAQTYWDKAVNIKNMADLPKINPVGRGGTAFKDFFEDYRKKLHQDFDVIVVLTDGGIFDLDQLKVPHCDTVWVLTNSCQFKPNFGRVAPLRGI